MLRGVPFFGLPPDIEHGLVTHATAEPFLNGRFQGLKFGILFFITAQQIAEILAVIAVDVRRKYGLVYPATDIDPFRASPRGQAPTVGALGEACLVGNGMPFPRVATQQWPRGDAPCGRARKRSSAALCLLERERPFPARQALRLTASWLAEWVNISGGVH